MQKVQGCLVLRRTVPALALAATQACLQGCDMTCWEGKCGREVRLRCAASLRLAGHCLAQCSQSAGGMQHRCQDECVMASSSVLSIFARCIRLAGQMAASIVATCSQLYGPMGK